MITLTLLRVNDKLFVKNLSNALFRLDQSGLKKLDWKKIHRLTIKKDRLFCILEYIGKGGGEGLNPSPQAR